MSPADCTSLPPPQAPEIAQPAASWPEVVAAPQIGGVVSAAPAGLMALERRRAECVAVVNVSKTDVENIPEYREALDLERLIASSSIQTVSDVRAKLLHVQRGVQTGELGTEERALNQVIAWLGQGEPTPPSEALDKVYADAIAAEYARCPEDAAGTEQEREAAEDRLSRAADEAYDRLLTYPAGSLPEIIRKSELLTAPPYQDHGMVPNYVLSKLMEDVRRLADKASADASQIAYTWSAALTNWLDAKERYRLADVESLRLCQEAKALVPERPEELTLKLTIDGVACTRQLLSYHDIDRWLFDLPHRKGLHAAATAALSNWYDQCGAIWEAKGLDAADERLELLMGPMDAAYDEMLRTPTPDAEALNIKFAAILEREEYEIGMDILAETARKHGRV